ncbi:MAG: hypothetical protein AB7N76_31480 [Planctomycetota bacterium]
MDPLRAAPAGRRGAARLAGRLRRPGRTRHGLEGGSGAQLARRLRAEGADTPFLFMSASLPHEVRAEVGFPCEPLEKPFSRQELLARVRAPLGRRR